MPDVEVKIFGPLRDIVGADRIALAVPPPGTGEKAFEALASRYPAVSPWKASVRLAVNLEYVPLETLLHVGDEVCFIPPVSGG